MSQTLNVDKDAFSSGQIGSKLWLCEELEKLYSKIDLLAIYGGWYGTTAFMLKVRDNIEISRIVSLDINPACQPVADMINEYWVWQDWTFKAHTEDCNKAITSLRQPDVIINTSTEHFENRDWWDFIPRGTVVVLQGNNMPHDDHYITTNSAREFAEQFPVTERLYLGEREFVYPNWQFTRYMLIGIK